MHIAYSTKSVGNAQAFEYWTDLICDVYVGLDCDCSERSRFEAEIVRFDTSQFRLSEISGSAHRAVRSSKRLEHSPNDDVLANLQIGGRTSIFQSGRRVELCRGDLAFYDASLEYEIVAESNFRTLVFQLPRRTFSERNSEIGSAVGHKLDGAFGLARPILRFLSEVPNASEEAGVNRAILEQYSVDLLRTAMSLVAPGQKRPTSAQTEACLLRAKQIVEEQLSDPEFNREQLALLLGISVRGLSRLFSDEKVGPSDYIRLRRLEYCRRALLDPNSTTRTITEIAFCYGFNDSAHFSSVFRGAYGQSPRDYRMAFERCR